MNEDNGRCLTPESLFEHFSGIDNGLIDDTFLDGFYIDDSILGIKVYNPELFILQPAHGGLAIVE